MIRIRSPQRGFTLIEVLIALLVLSFGVLAALGLQVVASSNVQNASQRMIATNLAYDLIDRMRSNSQPDANAVYMSVAGAELGGGTRGASQPSPTCNAGSACSPAELALHDLWEWERMLDGHTQTASDGVDIVPTGGLVDPTACLFGPTLGGDGRYQVVMVWRSATESENPVFGDTNIDSCGNGTDRYGTNNVNRRVLAVTTYIAR